MQRTLFWIALFVLAACPAIAQPTAASTPVSRPPTTGEQKIHRLVPSKPAETRGDLNRVGGLDTRAWTTVAGWTPGRSAFPDAKTYSWQLPLLSIGHAPWP